MSLKGCQWQDKSFNVAVSENKILNYCSKCNTEIKNFIFKYNGEILCSSCFANRPSVKKSGIGIFNTSKDKLWEFKEEFKGRQYEIRTKGQWKRFMKERGLHDDVKQSPRKKDDFIKNEYKPVPRKEIAECMLQELHDKGLYHKLIKRR